LTLLGVAAAIWLAQQLVFQIRYGGMPIAAWTVGFAPDCSWGSTAVAWIDANANGLYDKGEQPLPGVEFHIDDILNHSSDVGRPASIDNSKGEASLAVWLPGCPSATFEVYPDIPTGYHLTTKPKLSADVRQFGRMLEFGFTYLPGVPTATPAPPSPKCNSYQIGVANQYDVTDVAVASDGTVWAATFGNGVARYLLDQDKWMSYTIADGLVSNKVRSITPMKDGTIWFAADGGASRWDGSRWTSYTVSNGLIHSNVYRIAQAADGSIWFATQGGASLLKPNKDSWTSYTTKDGLGDDFVHSVAVTPDGSVWFPTVISGVSRLMPPSEPGANPQWVTYSAYTAGDSYIPFSHIDQIEVAPDGTYWFSGLGGLMRLEPKEWKWKVYDYASTSSAFSGEVNAFTISADGSIWIASGTTAPVIYHFTMAPTDDSPEAWQFYDSRDGLPRITKANVGADQAVAIAVVSRDVVWVATREAITRCIFQK